MGEVCDDAQLPLATITELGNTVPPKATIETLPDVVLLDIFDFFVGETCKNEWLTLAHVCRRWRHIVFASPRRLNLQLHCTNRSPVKKTLGIWPVLPIKIHASGRRMSHSHVNGYRQRLCSTQASRSRVLHRSLWSYKVAIGRTRGRDHLSCMAFHFRPYRNCFYLPVALSRFTLSFLIPGTFHPRRWSLACLHCPDSNT